MRRALFVAIVAITFAACGPAATPSANPTTNPTAQPTATLFRCAGRTLTWDGTSAIDLTGTWAGDDDGVYYIREIGDQVWWLGMSGLGGSLASRGSDWTNVYRGTLAGSTITGDYVDVPAGQALLRGPVVMKLTKTTDGGISLVRSTPDSETEFGGKVLTPCNLG